MREKLVPPIGEHDAQQRQREQQRREEEEKHFQLPLRPRLPSASAARQARTPHRFRILNQVHYFSQTFVFIQDFSQHLGRDLHFLSL